MFDRICLWSHLVRGFCLLEDFKSQFQLWCLWFINWYFIFLHSILGGCIILRICPFFPGCPFYWHIVACSNLSCSFVFLQWQLLLLFFISNSVDLSLLPFFLDESGNGLSILFIFSKNQLLVFLIFAIVSFIYFYLWSDLYDFFPSANFWVFLFFFL